MSDHAPLRDREIVLLYGPPWDDPTRLSKHHLAAYLAQRNRVLYVESPLHPLSLLARPRLAGRLLASARGCRRAGPNLWVRRLFTPVPYHAATHLTASPIANRLGQRWIARALRRQFADLGMRSPLLIAGLPHAADLAPFVPRSALVYHCADEYRSVRGFPASLPALEQRLVRMADLVVVTAEALRPERAALNARTHWIPNGVEVEHFASARDASTPLARELADLPKPVLGFVGALAEWVDVELILRAAQTYPEWSFVVIGPGSERLSSAGQHANLHALGPRRYQDLPSYVKGFDCAIIPFRDSDLVRKADPIKAYEYLAAGLPVVSTDIPALRRFEQVVYLARSEREFLDQLARAVEESSPERVRARQEVARGQSWTARFAEWERLLRELPCAS